MNHGRPEISRRGFFKSLIGRRPVAREAQKQALVARINPRDCLAWSGGDCVMCYVKCPLSDEAIFLDDLKPVVREEKCTGCGICEGACHLVNDRTAIQVVLKTAHAHGRDVQAAFRSA
jgi:ferredoxin